MIGTPLEVPIDWQQDYHTLRSQQEAALARQINRLWEHSSYLHTMWRHRGGFDNAPDVTSFEAIPLISKHDLRQALDACDFLGTHLACDPSEVTHIHATSGTSGRPTYFGLTERDFEAWLEIFMRGFRLAGAWTGNIVLQGFAMSRGYAGAVPMVRGFERLGCVVLPLGAEAGSARLCDAIKRLRPDVLYASPSVVRRLADHFQEEYGRDPSDSSIGLIITGGEPGAGDPASKRALSAAWGAEVREAGGGSDICPLMWMECATHDGLHFVAGDEVLFEIIDPATGQAISVEDGVEGEIVYSHLRRQSNPLVRMRHADIVRVQVSKCGCGLTMPRIRFLGRSDDMLIVRGVKIFPSSVQAVVSEFVPHLHGAVALVGSPTGVIDGPLEVLCESGESDDAERIAAQFELRAREILGVRVHCRLVPLGTLHEQGAQKGRWMVTGAE